MLDVSEVRLPGRVRFQALVGQVAVGIRTRHRLESVDGVAAVVDGIHVVVVAAVVVDPVAVVVVGENVGSAWHYPDRVDDSEAKTFLGRPPAENKRSMTSLAA